MRAGVDGCRAGWVVVVDDRAWVEPTFASVMTSLPPTAVVAVDIPIGLLDVPQPGGRECDRLARARVGRARASSVFSAPTRPALVVTSLPEAQTHGFRMTLQTLNILPKIAEVDGVVDPALQDRVHEAFPELAFAALAGAPLAHSKRRAAGRAERHTLLVAHRISIPERPKGAAIDDLLDACVLAWSAGRIAEGTAERVPEGSVHVDARGLRMEIQW